MNIFLARTKHQSIIKLKLRKFVDSTKWTNIIFDFIFYYWSIDTYMKLVLDKKRQYKNNCDYQFISCQRISQGEKLLGIIRDFWALFSHISSYFSWKKNFSRSSGSCWCVMANSGANWSRAWYQSHQSTRKIKLEKTYEIK